jgi:histidyl-tRNA synthetase
MLFEIYDGDVNQGQLVGGGRYDDLAQTLGARQPLPACGFTYGLERLVDALAANDQPERDVTLIAPAGADALPAAIQIAEQLRAEGRIVELDVRGRSVSANRRYAERLGMTAMIVVQADGTQATETLRQPALATKEAAGE